MADTIATGTEKVNPVQVVSQRGQYDLHDFYSTNGGCATGCVFTDDCIHCPTWSRRVQSEVGRDLIARTGIVRPS